MTHGETSLIGARELAAVDEHRLRYHQLVEFSPDGHVLTDGQGVIVEANQTAAALLRCPKEFLVGKPLGLFVASGHRARFYESLAGLHRSASEDAFETRIGRRGGQSEVLLRVALFGEGSEGDVTFRWLLRDLAERREAESVRAELLRRLVTAQEDERRRVARELHDSFGQLLAALLLDVRAVRDSGPLPLLAQERLDEVQRVAELLGSAAHDLAVRLRPTALDDVGLMNALQHHLEDWSARSGVEVQFQLVGDGVTRLPLDVETALYRVVQEALTNVVRHAKATLVSVVIERPDGHVIAIVEDDGVGFHSENMMSGGRLGLLGMRERVALVGGSLEVESSPGAGTTIVARVPLRRRAAIDGPSEATGPSAGETDDDA